jgi:hypothetical protein
MQCATRDDVVLTFAASKKKRAYLFFILSASLLVVSLFLTSSVLGGARIFSTVSAQSAPPIWPTTQHDFGRTSEGSYPGPSSNTTDWIFGPTGSIQTSPVIGSDGTIYVVDSNFHLYAINQDGSIRWEQTFSEGLFSPAIGPSGTIYVPGARHLFAFAPTGTPVWTEPYNISTSRNSALVISPQGILFEVSSNGTLTAINPFGTVATTLWTLNTACIPATLAFGPSGSLYCGTNSNNSSPAVEAISSNGQLQWSYPTNSIVLVAPTVSPEGDIYVVESGGEILDLSAQGTDMWSISIIHQESISAVLGPNDVLYVDGTLGTQYNEYRLIALSQGGPTVIWSEFCYLSPSSLCYPFGAITSVVVDSAGTIYVGTNTTGLVALNDQGQLDWAYPSMPPGEGSPSPIAIGANGTLYVGTGCLYCNVTTYGHLLAIGQPSGYYSFAVGESGLPAGNSWSFVVNGENYSTSGTSLVFSLPNGSYSWDSPASAVPNAIGVRYASTQLQGSFSVPGTTNVSLAYSIEYQLNITATPGYGGSVSPVTGEWYTPGTQVPLNATAVSGYDFGVWSTAFGTLTPASSSSSNTSIAVNGPGSILGIFDPLVTVNAGPGGAVLYLDPPYVGTLQPGQNVSFYAPSESVLVLTARPVAGYSFQDWNTSSALGIDPSSNVLQFKISTPAVLTADFAVSQISSSHSSSTATTSTNQSSTTISSTTTTPPVVTIPDNSKLPTSNVALDLAAAVVVGLAIGLGIIVVLGLGLIRKK